MSIATPIHSTVSLPPITYKGQPVITTEMLAKAYGCDPKQIRQNLNNNKNRFVEGKHYFYITGQELKTFRDYIEIFDIVIPPRTRHFTLYTESGSLYHAKSIGTDEAWAVYDILVETFFRVVGKEPQSILDRLSHKDDPERKELTAMINAWVGVAPIHYAGARAIVNAHIGVKSVDDMTVSQVKRAIAFVNGKISEAGQGQKALPVAHYAFEAQVDNMVAGIQDTIRQLKRQTGELHNLCLAERKKSPHFLAHDKGGEVNSRAWRTIDPLHHSLDYMLDAIEQNALLMKAAS